MSNDRLFAFILGVFIAFAIVSESGFLGPSQRLLVVSIFGLIILAWAFWRLRNGLPNKVSYFAFIIMFLGIGLMALQLVPLPPNIWSGLAGRQFLNKDFATLGLSDQWMPLSLSPATTRQDIIALLPGLATFFGIVSLSTKEWRVVVWSLVVLALVSALVGLAQRFQGQNGPFNFYHYVGAVTASGFFANRNFCAAELYSTIAFIAALSLRGDPHSLVASRLKIFFGLVLGIIVIAGIGATGSRTGALLLVVALFALLFMVMSALNAKNSVRRRFSPYIIVGLLIGGLVTAQLLLIALLRFSTIDIASDYRGIIYETSLPALMAFYPLGSGFGSFVPVYQLFEKPNVIIDHYVNHAHSDWLELLIEGGLPVGILLACFLIWFLYVLSSAWRTSGENLFVRAASISAGLLLVHSLVDFPIRAPGIMCLFGIFCGMLSVGVLANARPPQQPRSPKLVESEEVVGFKPSARGFRPRNMPQT